MSRDAIPRENLGVHKDRDINFFMCRSEARTAMLRASLTVIAWAIAWAKAVSPETVEFEEGDKLYQALDALCRLVARQPASATLRWAVNSQSSLRRPGGWCARRTCVCAYAPVRRCWQPPHCRPGHAAGVHGVRLMLL